MTSHQTILVTGGAGYIGSHAVLALRDNGRSVVVVDDFSTGYEHHVAPGVPVVRGDVGDCKLIADTIRNHDVGAVLHFAAKINISESVAAPLDYYRGNAEASRCLIATCIDEGVDRFVFSSSAAVYGAPKTVPILESAPTRPINPYGRTKLITEWMLEDVARSSGLCYAALRYFNVAGADPQGRSGETSSHAGHLLKVAGELVTGQRSSIEMYGDDYDTRDGTCIRDYVHVTDLANAHLLVLDKIGELSDQRVFNCGYGQGFSVREVLTAVESEIGSALDIRVGPRRPGDPPALVADPGRFHALGWRPEYADLGTMIRSAVAWERKILAHSAIARDGEA